MANVDDSLLILLVVLCFSVPSKASPDFWKVLFALPEVQTAFQFLCIVEMVLDLHQEIVSGRLHSEQFQNIRHPTEDRFAVPEVLASYWVEAHQLL